MRRIAAAKDLLFLLLGFAPCALAAAEESVLHEVAVQEHAVIEMTAETVYHAIVVEVGGEFGKSFGTNAVEKIVGLAADPEGTDGKARGVGTRDADGVEDAGGGFAFYRAAQFCQRVG